MKRKLRSLNNVCDSLIITIPIYMVETLELYPNKEVNIELKGKKIIIDTNVENAEEN